MYDVPYLDFHPIQEPKYRIPVWYFQKRPYDLMMPLTKDIIHESLIHSFITKYLLSAGSLPGAVLVQTRENTVTFSAFLSM